MDVVFPVADAALQLSTGASFTVRRGQHWSAEDAVVKEHPDQFSTDPRYGLAFSAPPAELAEPPVEQATAAPGERRAVRRG
jgi:hypothetical protein